MVIACGLTAPAIADDHLPDDLRGWCAASRPQTAACVVGAAVVVPTVALVALGEAYERACIDAGYAYLPPEGDGWQWRCTQAD